MKVILSFAVVFILSQAQEISTEEKTCLPRFKSYVFVFVVNNRSVRQNQTLGKVRFNICAESDPGLKTNDHRFQVHEDGTVSATMDFRFSRLWDYFHIFPQGSLDKALSATVVILVSEHLDLEVTRESDLTSESQKELPVLTFPKQGLGYRKQKRDWITPSISIYENKGTQLPMRLGQVKSSRAKETPVTYSITGQGADQDPKGIFIINKTTGWLSVTQPLDRETKSFYNLMLYSVGSHTGELVEEPMELIINVIDQNDNRPEFTQEVFEGCVPAGVPPGTPVMTITATDADDPETDNARLGYSIVRQEPESLKMFTVNEDTGVISTIISGLNREYISMYTLIVQVADMGGEGLINTATAVIHVTDGKVSDCDHTPNKVLHSVELTAYAQDKDSGTPASNLSITVYRSHDRTTQKWNLKGKGVTDSTGHNYGLLTPGIYSAGIYKMRFETGEYWRRQGRTTLYPFIEIAFLVTEQAQKIHIPLLFNATSYSTYEATKPQTKPQQ
ncbi:cadherin-1-like [Protopterus annectens]|uniref:cadherin-1-like n=1 Tax=Protopterus annectens TaxID=7888 RepID=UPI001CFADB19|nr:cadherin-1-like [Protopterus annectens]